VRTLVDIYDYCITKPGTTEDLPFGPTPLVFKVVGKIYVFVGNDEDPPTIAIKGQPENIAQLREQYESVFAGPYLNAKHWASVRLTGEVPDAVLRQLIDQSYALVVAGLPKAKRP
jgi:predicted DNA-binding protein (MmcQ/YjbR family)